MTPYYFSTRLWNLKRMELEAERKSPTGRKTALRREAARAGVSMSHSATYQSRSFPRVPRDSLAPGDLLFFYNTIRHVGMYVGGGKMINATAPGDVVRVVPINWNNFSWANRPRSRR